MMQESLTKPSRSCPLFLYNAMQFICTDKQLTPQSPITFATLNLIILKSDLSIIAHSGIFYALEQDFSFGSLLEQL